MNKYDEREWVRKRTLAVISKGAGGLVGATKRHTGTYHPVHTEDKGPWALVLGKGSTVSKGTDTQKHKLILCRTHGKCVGPYTHVP